ncbi:MAG TPA: SDR family oxidoreductase [Actinomycetota bacterium]|nr:SDR family oxidoreductase [Actinomycetota bacterium]
MQLNNTVGILTGASRGIGVHLAEHLARKGVDLALAARTEEGLTDTAERVRTVGVKAITVPTDVTKKSDLKRLVARAEAEVGPVDLVVNNAGIEHYDRFEEVDPRMIENIIHTNVLAAMLLTRYALPRMVERGRGHIVNMSSAAGKIAVPYNTTYSASKHALVGFSWSLREELRSYGIGVSVVCPGFVRNTGMATLTLGRDEPPKIAGAVDPEKVAEETLRAIEKNKPEVVIAGGLGKVADVFFAISPDLSATVARRGGLYDLLRKNVGRA